MFVTAPSPENLKTLFEMVRIRPFLTSNSPQLQVLKGFDALEYKEHQDYEIVQSTNPALNKAVVRINIFHTHRQVRCLSLCFASFVL